MSVSRGLINYTVTALVLITSVYDDVEVQYTTIYHNNTHIYAIFSHK